MERASDRTYFVFGVWWRPGFTRRDRPWVTLSCVGAADGFAKGEARCAAAEAAWAARPGR